LQGYPAAAIVALESGVLLKDGCFAHARKESMGFARQAGVAVLLVTMTLLIQGAGMAVLIHWARASIARGIRGMSALNAGVLMIRFTTVTMFLHTFQILLWAGFYRWYCLPSWETGFYFSAASYSTVGYGDVVLPRVWRLLGPIESVTGVVMCGLSVSFLFAILTRLVDAEFQSSPEAPAQPSSIPSPETESFSAL
jgi:voltage-gated potassium channel